MCLFAILIGLKVVEMEYMSQEGYDKLVAELRELELVKLPEVREAIAEARDKGDLSENLSSGRELSSSGFATHNARREILKSHHAIYMNATSADFSPMPDGIGQTGAVPTIAGSPLCPAAPCVVVTASWQKKNCPAFALYPNFV